VVARMGFYTPQAGWELIETGACVFRPVRPGAVFMLTAVFWFLVLCVIGLFPGRDPWFFVRSLGIVLFDVKVDRSRGRDCLLWPVDGIGSQAAWGGVVGRWLVDYSAQIGRCGGQVCSKAPPNRRRVSRTGGWRAL